MSFILDALKKSENDRQRQSGPAVFEMKIASPRQGLPGWAWGLAALLAVNLGVVGWLVVRQPAPAQTRAAQATVATQAATAPAAVTTRAVTPPAPLPVAAAAPAAGGAMSPTPPVNSNANSNEEKNPEDYEPATEPAAPTAAAQASSAAPPARTATGLPSYEQIAGTPGSGLPELRMDLHVYAAKPQERFVFINMHRLHEGDSLPDGVRVESITNDGAILSWRGTKFSIDRE